MTTAPPSASFTPTDMQHCGRYAGERQKLQELAILANRYPQIASYLNVKITYADPEKDYRFNPTTFYDRAIIVDVTWHESGRACKNLNCYSSYPLGGGCTADDPVRVFPSGLNSDAVACQPACFMRKRIREIERRNPNLRIVSDADPKLCVECSMEGISVPFTAKRRLTGEWLNAQTNQLYEQAFKGDYNNPSTDSVPLAWSTADGCVLDDINMLRFILEPFHRDPSHAVCRLTNFNLGDDLVRNAQTGLSVGTHPPTYCRAFNKNWNPESLTCDETWWSRVLGYTFFGNALVRLASMMDAGGHGCDKWFTPNAARYSDERARETEPGAGELTDPASYSYEGWRSDVDTTWVLPPYNILLSDLGIDPRVTGNLIYWQCREGLVARFQLLRTVRQATASGQVIGSPWSEQNTDYGRATQIILARSGNVPANDSAYDLSYDDIVKTIEDMCDDEAIAVIIRDLGIQVGVDLSTWKLSKILRKYGKRLVAFTAKRFAGTASRMLLKIGLRYGLAMLTGRILARFTTRALIALGMIASGVGTVIGVVELLATVLDLAVLVGWDPGNYNSEFDLRVYQDYQKAWANYKSFHGITPFDPMSLIYLLLNAPNGDTDTDGELGEGARANLNNFNATAIDDEDADDDEIVNVNERVNEMRWYNTMWPQCFVRESEYANTDPPIGGKRLPLVNGDLAMTSCAWEYMGYLRTNSLGQVVITNDDEKVALNDESLVTIMSRMDYNALLRTSRQDDERRGEILSNGEMLRSRFSYVAMASTGTAFAIIVIFLTLLWPVSFLLAAILCALAITVLVIPLVAVSNLTINNAQLLDGFSVQSDTGRLTWKNLANYLLDHHGKLPVEQSSSLPAQQEQSRVPLYGRAWKNARNIALRHAVH